MKAIASFVMTWTVIGFAIEAALRFGRWQAWAVVVFAVGLLTLAQFAREDKAP